VIQTDLQAQFRQLIEKTVDRQAHNMVAGIRLPDGRVEMAAAGFADATGRERMTVDTPYYLASITKMYTATVVMKLARASQLDLDAPVSRYLPADLIEGILVIDGVDHSAKITVAQLLAQTSGLADYFEGKPKGGESLVDALVAGRDRALDLSDILDIVRGLPPDFAPRQRESGKAKYSDTNYALLGGIIEAVTGQSVAHNFREHIFSPLNLSDTYVFDHTEDRVRPAAMFHQDRAVDIPLAMSSFAPDGGVVSTVRDSLSFLWAFFEGGLLSSDQLGFMTRSWNRIFFPLRYGAGIMRFRVSRWMSPFAAPPDLIGHSGSTGSFAFREANRSVYVAGTINQMDKPGLPYRLMTKMVGLPD
jgi:CubicO group peptidase (beta-lactamase class C family)